MFVRNAWYVAATAGEIGRSLTQRWICGEPVVLYRTEAGQAVALEDRCPHRKAALSMGRLKGDEIECGYHGLCFDSAGLCTRVPGQVSIPPRLRARAYKLVERHGWVWLWLGAPEAADPAKVPDYHWNESPGWTPVFGYLHVKADYRLLIDNLMDLTHETFVHPTSIGETVVADTPIATKAEGQRVTVSRLMPECPAPPLFRKVRGLTTIDRWQHITYEPPGNIRIDAGGMPSDTKDMGRALRWWVLNALTPETETTTHYFWSVTRCFSLDDDALSRTLHDQVMTIFNEDAVVLEMQQKLIETDRSSRPLLSVNCDAGGSAARRILGEIERGEQAVGAVA